MMMLKGVESIPELGIAAFATVCPKSKGGIAALLAAYYLLSFLVLQPLPLSVRDLRGNKICCKGGSREEYSHSTCARVSRPLVLST